MSQVPDRLSNFMAHKQYLHATELLVEAVTLGKNTLEGVESLKELSRELEQKKEQLHLQLFTELKEHLFTRPAQRILALRRQESGRDNFMINSPLQRSTELRLSRNRMAVRRNIFETAQKYNHLEIVPSVYLDIQSMAQIRSKITERSIQSLDKTYTIIFKSERALAA